LWLVPQPEERQWQPEATVRAHGARLGGSALAPPDFEAWKGTVMGVLCQPGTKDGTLQALPPFFSECRVRTMRYLRRLPSSIHPKFEAIASSKGHKPSKPLTLWHTSLIILSGNKFTRNINTLSGPTPQDRLAERTDSDV
jgi:hypothetical protein